MSEKIAVIGSNSFSGASFVRSCLEQGLEVLGTTHHSAAAASLQPRRR